MSRFVYLISQGDNVHKIGVSAVPESRLKSLQCGHSHALNLVSVWEPKNVYRVERVAHIHLADCRISGEWFRVSAADAVLVIERSIHDATLPRNLDQRVAALKAGPAKSAENRRKKSDDAIKLHVEPYWPLPSKAYPTAALVAASGLSLNTIKDRLGPRPIAQYKHQQIIKRREKREQSKAT